MTLNQFLPGIYKYTCNFSSGGKLTFTINETTEPETWDTGKTCSDSRHGDTVWVTINSVSSNQITVP
jgi:hypothetical protein